MSGSLAGAMAGTEAMAALFGAAGGARALLAVEAGFARAAARSGRISPAAAAAIGAACDGAGAAFATLDLAALARAGAVAGTIVLPLVGWLRGRVGVHAGAVHHGLTSQDVIDTALVLQLRDGLALLEADLAAAAAAAAGLAHDHAATPMLARTLLQPALPTCFGLKAAGWMAGLDDALAGLRAAAAATRMTTVTTWSRRLAARKRRTEMIWP
ncbi:MAG: lyase family protein, partial [Acetobacteraceae bacterium]